MLNREGQCLAPKPDNLSSVSRTSIVDGKPTPPSCSVTSRHVHLNELCTKFVVARATTEKPCLEKNKKQKNKTKQTQTTKETKHRL